MPVPSPYASLLADVPVREAEISVLGGTTRYWDYGPEDAETVMVVAHGYRGEHHGLEPVIAHLQGIRVIGADMPGFGLSTALTEVAHDIPGYASWLTAFVDKLGLTGKAVIFGHSFGSIIASHAVANGLATPRLILLNPIAAPALSGPKAILTWLTVVFYRTGKLLPVRAGNWLLSNRLAVHLMSATMVKTRDKQLRRWIHDQHHTYFSNYSDRDTVVAGFLASISSDVSVVADRITVPTLLLGSDQDPITTVDAIRELEHRFADAKLVILEDVGHLIHYEMPREAATEIVAFLGAGAVAEPGTR
jgi:pimeloyl-ACP methyl ester carboxylesterase